MIKDLLNKVKKNEEDMRILSDLSRLDRMKLEQAITDKYRERNPVIEIDGNKFTNLSVNFQSSISSFLSVRGTKILRNGTEGKTQHIMYAKLEDLGLDI